MGQEADERKRSLPTRLGWRVRNFAWKTAAPTLGYALERYVPVRSIRYATLNEFYRAIVPLMMTRLVTGEHTIPTDQMIRYPDVAGRSKYTFSIWAFPEERYAEILREYFHWVTSTGITIDPCSTAAPGWTDFLDAYNVFCSEHEAKPLLNQTPRLTRAQVGRAFGDRIDRFEEYRRRFDPEDRLLNSYFRDLLHTRAVVDAA